MAAPDLGSYDSVCSFCDDGGVMLCCEGICKRSFHASPQDPADPDDCVSLGFTEEEAMAMTHFQCRNCQLRIHQCFSCGQLGSSDIPSGAAEVFQCAKATCGYLYHPGCVARQLNGDGAAAQVLLEHIRSGAPFTCPHHICHVCQHAEDESNPDLQMAVCRRCPKAYHRRCLPGGISIDDHEGIFQRAWDHLLPNRILMYCLDHDILPHLGTPMRNHIRFPDDAAVVNGAMIQLEGQEMSDDESHATITDVSSGALSEHSEDEDSIHGDP